MYFADPSVTYVDANGPFSSQLPALSAADLISLWVNAGGDHNVADQAAAVALAESAGVPNAINPTDYSGVQTSWGLWQLSNGTHNAPGVNWAVPSQNAAGAVAKYNNAGGTFARDWGTYGGSSYEQYLAEIQSGNVSTSDPFSQNSNLGDSWIEKGINVVTGGEYDKLKNAANGLYNLSLIPEHIVANLGPFLVGMMLIAIGGGLMMFSWGERLVDGAEKLIGNNVARLDGGSSAPAPAAAGAAGEDAAAAAV